MINLYDSMTKPSEFGTNGIAVLNKCIQCTITEENNGIYELLLEYPMEDAITRVGTLTPKIIVGKHVIGEQALTQVPQKWTYLVEGNVIKADGQLFRIYHKTTSTASNSRTVNARHIFYDNTDNQIPAVNLNNVTGAYAMEYLTTHTAYAMNYQVVCDLGGNGSYTSVAKNVVDSILGTTGIVSIFGGEIVRDNFDINLLTHRGSDKGVLIAVGKDIQGITEDVDMDAMCTRAYPSATAYNGKIVTLPEEFIDSPLIGNYPNPKIKGVTFATDQMPLANVTNLAVTNANTNAVNAKALADAGVLTTAWATPIVSDASDEAKVTPAEKVALKGLWTRINAEKPYIDSQSTLYFKASSGTYDTLDLLKADFPNGNGNTYLVTADSKWYFYNGLDWKDTVPITTQKTDYTNAYNVLSPYILPLIKNLTTTTTGIVAATMIAKFAAYYTAKDIILTTITQKLTEQLDIVQAAQNLIYDVIALRALTVAYFGLSSCDLPATNYVVNLLQLSSTVEYANYKQLETVLMGDIVTVKHSKWNLNFKDEVIKTTKNVLTNRLELIELGTAKGNVAGTINTTIQAIKAEVITVDNISKYVTFVDGQVNSVQTLLDGNLTGSNFAPYSITGGQISTGSITAANIAGGTITGDLIQANVITGDLIMANTLTAEQIQAGSITATEIAAKTLTADQIKAGAITATEISSGTITADQIKSGSITADTMVAGTITAASGIIADAAIGTTQIADGSISDAKIVNLTASKITAGTIDAGVIDVINLHADNITVGTINGTQIAPATITSGNIASGTIQAGNIAAGTITAAQLMEGTITGNEIALGAIASQHLNVSAHMLF